MEELLVFTVDFGVDTVVGAVVGIAVRQTDKKKILLLRHSNCLKMQHRHTMHMLEDIYIYIYKKAYI